MRALMDRNVRPKKKLGILKLFVPGKLFFLRSKRVYTTRNFVCGPVQGQGPGAELLQAERKVVEEDLLLSGYVENKHEGSSRLLYYFSSNAAWWWWFTAAEAADTY